MIGLTQNSIAKGADMIETGFGPQFHNDSVIYTLAPYTTLVSYSLMFHLKQRLQIVVYDMQREEENNPDFTGDVLPAKFVSDELVRAARVYVSLQDNPEAQKKYVNERQARVKEMMSIRSFSSL